MAIFITGDIHGDPCRFSTSDFPIQKDFKEDEENYVIILGDFGLVWTNPPSAKERHWLDWLNDKPFTTLFCDGNHENFELLSEYPIEEWKGGRVQRIRPNVIHLMRGEVYTIQGLSFFSFGGASSHDISDGILSFENWIVEAQKLRYQGKYMYRIKGWDWWEEELPSAEEMHNGMKNLANHDFKVDYIITHSPSTSEQVLISGGAFTDTDCLTNYLDEVKSKTKYKKHFFGHLHKDKCINEKDRCIYQDIIQVY